MFSLTSMLYMGAFLWGFVGSVLYNPIYGVLLYLGIYYFNPISHWWGIGLTNLGFRHSFFAASAVMLGLLLQKSKLNFKSGLTKQEVCLVFLVLIIALSNVWSVPCASNVSNWAKMIKVAVILIACTHIVTDLDRFDKVSWIIIIGAFYMAYQAYFAPEWTFTNNRLDKGIGGVDFNDSNFVSSVFAIALPLVAVQFFRGNWKKKLICLALTTFIVNGMILCRSRGAFLAVALGLMWAVFFASKGKRMQIFVLSMALVLGGSLLVDPGYLMRMQKIHVDSQEIDQSSMGRILAWKAAMGMFLDHPMGIGEGKFSGLVGKYNPQISGIDTHSTYFRCLAELGICGISLLFLMIVNAFMMLRKISSWAYSLQNAEHREAFIWNSFAVKISLIILLACGVTMTQTYLEFFYWFLMLPVFLWRSMENYEEVTEEGQLCRSSTSLKLANSQVPGSFLDKPIGYLFD